MWKEAILIAAIASSTIATTTSRSTTTTTQAPVDCNQACVGKEQWDFVSMGCCLDLYCMCAGDGEGGLEYCAVGGAFVCGDEIEDPNNFKPPCSGRDCSHDACCQGSALTTTTTSAPWYTTTTSRWPA